MDLVRVVFEIEPPFILNNELVIRDSPMALDWWQGQDLVVDILKERFLVNLVDDAYSIEINPDLFLVRKKAVLSPTAKCPLQFYFLSLVQKGELEKARKLLGFEISVPALKKFFGEFDIILNNYLDCPKTFSILPKGERVARNLVFTIEGERIVDIT